MTDIEKTMTKYAEPLSDAVSLNGAAVGVMTVANDLLEKARHTSSRKLSDEMVKDSSNMLTWLIENLVEYSTKGRREVLQ